MRLLILILMGVLNLSTTVYALPADDPYELMLREQERVREAARAERKKYLFPQGERYLSEIEKNTIVSLRWFAAAGDLESQVSLADLYAKGITTPQDYKAAYYWYALAGEYGNTYGQYMAALIQQLGFMGEPNAEKAALWFSSAQKQDDRVRAMRRVAQFFSDPQNPSHSDTQAYRWYEQAAYAGDIESQNVMGDWYAQGDKVRQNILMAMKWYGKAAAQNSPYAQYSLAVIYLQNHEDVPLDYTQALEWLQKSAAQGFHAAQYALGKMYHDGKGVQPNQILAYAWMKMSNVLDNDGINEELSRLTQKMSADELEQASQLYSIYAVEVPVKIAERESNIDK